MGSWLSSNTRRSTLFRNVQLVGHPDGEYSVLVEDGVVKRISTTEISGAFDVIDCTDRWLAPVRMFRPSRLT
jgi:imidazolonepropionase-like amidohydrolase